MAAGRTAASRVARLRELTRLVARAFRDHNLFTYASAISFRGIVAFVPLTLLGFALLGTFGLEDAWRDTLAPAIKGRVTPPVFEAMTTRLSGFSRQAAPD
jgi:uncharacterized BrkB/YihY/UPF0761 family membrane protein